MGITTLFYLKLSGTIPLLNCSGQCGQSRTLSAGTVREHEQALKLCSSLTCLFVYETKRSEMSNDQTDLSS